MKRSQFRSFMEDVAMLGWKTATPPERVFGVLILFAALVAIIPLLILGDEL